MYTRHEEEWRYKHRERDRAIDNNEEDDMHIVEAERYTKMLSGEEDTMRYGIDVSENNSCIPWDEVAAEVDFVIIRLGYGNCHLDEDFWDNYEQAKAHGLSVGVYYYSYALDVADARNEAEFLVETLREGGITDADLPMGVWFDMEDADGYKRENDVWDGDLFSEMCAEFVNICKANGYTCGVYASLSWFEDFLDIESYCGKDIPIWCAQWDSECDMENATIWQYTDCLEIGGRCFDGNILMQ